MTRASDCSLFYKVAVRVSFTTSKLNVFGSTTMNLQIVDFWLWTITTIQTTVKGKILEALHIVKLQPTINAKDECESVQSFLLH